MIRLAALLLTVATGFAGLVYEVAWQKYLATLLGSHAEATAAILAIFLGGLSAGYALFGHVTRVAVERARRRGRSPRLLYLYALVEGGIGVYALLFPTLFGVAQHLSLLVPTDSAGLAFGFDVALSALLIGTPTILMGGTIPILTLALAGSLDHATRVHAWVYGCNTVGAFAGALAGGFLLIPALGLDGVVYSMGCVNLVAAALFAQLDRGAGEIAPDLAESLAAPPLAGFAAWAGVALLAGFAMMALQTTLNRVGALALGSSEFTFAMIVAVFVLCIALGSLAVSALPRIPRGLVVVSQWSLLLLLFPLYLAVNDVTYWAHVLRALFRQVDPAFYAYQIALFGALLAVLVAPIGLAGALLPLLFHELRREVRELGNVAGRLYAWNTVGSLLGALLGGYILLLWLDLHHVFRIAMAAVAVSATLLTLLVLRPRPLALPLALGAAALGAIALLPTWSQDRLTVGLFRSRAPLPLSFAGPEEFFSQRGQGELLFYDDDPTSTVDVVENRNGNRSIVVNGKSDGSIKGDYVTMALSALLPALMAERHERCFVIGLGLGVTAGELAALDETRSVDVAEISRGVIAASPFFDEGNLGASKNPKIRIRRGDAYRTLLQSEETFDVIVSEPSNPWVTGVEMLYSREFLEAAHSRLSPGGVYAQWFHVYESDTEVVELVLRTYASVFPRVSVWFTLGSDLLLLGFDRPDRALDVEALAARFRRPDFREGFARVEIETLPQLFAHELLPLGTLHAGALEGEIHTLRHPVLSHAAARAFFRGEHAEFPHYVSAEQQRIATQNSLLRRLAGNGKLPENLLEAGVRETCRFRRRQACATFLARWAVDYPGSPRREDALEEARNGLGRARGALSASQLARIRVLFDGRLRAMTGEAGLTQAEMLTSRFLSHYHHAVPFDRSVVESAWERCEVEGCAEGRRLAEAELGGLRGNGARPARRAEESPGIGRALAPAETTPATETATDLPAPE
jgi:spermidine synthase